MKNTLLAVAAATTLVFTATYANADANSWYLGVFGGVNWMDGDDSTFIIHDSDIEFETGYAVGGALGYKFENNIRTEVEFAYRDNKAEKFEYDDFPGSSLDLDGRIRISSIMANAWYDFDITQKLKGHVGGGMGVASVNAKELGTKKVFGGLSIIDGDDTVFAYQGGAGLSYPVGKSVDMTLDYRVFGTREAQLSKRNGIAGSISPFNHTILAGIRVSFGACN